MKEHHDDSMIPAFSRSRAPLRDVSEGVRQQEAESFQKALSCACLQPALGDKMAACSEGHGSPVCLSSGGPSVPRERACLACDVGNELPLGTN